LLGANAANLAEPLTEAVAPATQTQRESRSRHEERQKRRRDAPEMP